MTINLSPITIRRPSAIVSICRVVAYYPVECAACRYTILRPIYSEEMHDLVANDPMFFCGDLCPICTKAAQARLEAEIDAMYAMYEEDVEDFLIREGSIRRDFQVYGDQKPE